MNTLSLDIPPPIHPRATQPTIVACLSMSSRAMGVAAEAWRLARRWEARLHLLHVGPYTAAGRRRLHRSLSAASVPLDDVALTVVPGLPERRIASFARNIGASMIVAGVLDADATLEELAASTAGRIVRDAGGPVMLVSRPQVTPRPLNTFVAAVDFDEVSHQMLGWTLDWMRAEGATSLFVIHEMDGAKRLRRGSGKPHPASPDDAHVHAEFLKERTAALREMIHRHDTRGIQVHVAAMRSKTDCDPLWYATAVWADVFCVPITDQRLDQWARLIRHRAGFRMTRTACRLAAYRPPA